MEVAGQGMSNCRSTLLGGALSGRQPIVQSVMQMPTVVILQS